MSVCSIKNVRWICVDKIVIEICCSFPGKCTSIQLIGKTDAAGVMCSEPTMTVAAWLYWMHWSSSHYPLNWSNVINSLSAPVPVPNWSIPRQRHQPNYGALPCCWRSPICWAAGHTSPPNWGTSCHHCRPMSTRNCLFRPLHESIWKQIKFRVWKEGKRWERRREKCRTFWNASLILVPMHFVVHWSVHLKIDQVLVNQ